MHRQAICLMRAGALAVALAAPAPVSLAQRDGVGPPTGGGATHAWGQDATVYTRDGYVNPVRGWQVQTLPDGAQVLVPVHVPRSQPMAVPVARDPAPRGAWEDPARAGEVLVVAP